MSPVAEVTKKMEDMLVLFVSAYPELYQTETPLGADQLDTCAGIVLRVGSLLFCGVNPLLTYCKLSAKLMLIMTAPYQQPNVHPILF